MLCVSLCLLVAFVMWTLLVRFVDVRGIGPRGSSVGLATLNQFVHNATGTNMALYVITDWLGLVPIATALGFAVLGLCQWVGRRSILKVDRSIIALGVFYAAVMAAYIFFEYAVINYRPVLIDGVLEASYPSSTTLLTLCVMPTAAMQTRARIKNTLLRRITLSAIWIFTAFMLTARIFSGVHWITDIIGGILLSAGLVLAYGATAE
jgi:undecaprenyl-diphosphatase